MRNCHVVGYNLAAGAVF